MPEFFIDRPVFALVLTIILSIAGVLAINSLPVAQYPNLAPPVIRVSATYPGASAQTLENTVTQIIEQNMTGLDNLLYMASQSSNNGRARVTLTFNAGVDPNVAMQQVQNQLQPALRKLPQEVQQLGINVSKSGDSTLMMLGFVSTDGTMQKEDIADYAITTLQDPLSRVDGVGSVDVFSSPYAMRIWLDPAKLNNYKLTTQDVVEAVRTQNIQLAVGQLGGTPAVANQALNATINAQSQLQTPAEFRAILLRVNPNGSRVTLGDIATVELGSDSYDYVTRYNGMPAAGIGITLASGANELQTSKLVKEKLAELEPFFPKGLQAKIAYETTPFVTASIIDVVKTLLEAVGLVFLVMYLFLQNLRATLITTIVVPVVLLGTFAIFYLLGFSINTLTMFAMVLAIGLLVDDAIVVVENVERIMVEENLPPREATRKSMGQIQGALVGIALVLSAVFIPMSFFGGTTGAIYRQFSLTIVTSMVLSVLVAMILTPALCATLLKPKATTALKSNQAEAQTRKGFFAFFNHLLYRQTRNYQVGVHYLLRHRIRSVLLYLLLSGSMAWLFLQLPGSFMPQEDRGIFTVAITLPVGATQQQTLQVTQQVENYFLQQEQRWLVSILSNIGTGPGGNGQNVARLFIKLKPWSERQQQQASSDAIITRANHYFKQIKAARVIAINPPVISGLGAAGGFDMMLEDHAGLGHDALMAAKDQLLQLASEQNNITGVRHNGQQDGPQLQLNIDHTKAKALGISLDSINNTLKTALGSTYVNDFIDRGRLKKVYIQAAAPYRMLPADLESWYVRNSSGQMVPFSAFSSSEWTVGSPRLERFNGNPSLQIVGEAAKGYSTGSAMQEMATLVAQLPPGIGFEWAGISYQEQLSGTQAPMLYAMSLLFVFLCLAALYESWSIPFAVMLVVPLGVLGSVIATWLYNLNNDIYFQVGLLTIIGLTAKNAILIVEFAHAANKNGLSLQRALLKACRMRLRPILMTSLALIFGVLPMALSSGVGSASQNAVGIAVVGGMITATLLSIYFTPLFFRLVQQVKGLRSNKS